VHPEPVWKRNRNGNAQAHRRNLFTPRRPVIIMRLIRKIIKPDRRTRTTQVAYPTGRALTGIPEPIKRFCGSAPIHAAPGCW
jgi:hypothetical protein